MHCLPIEEDHMRSNNTNIQPNWKVHCYICLLYFIPFHSLIHLFVIFHSIPFIDTFVCYISFHSIYCYICLLYFIPFHLLIHLFVILNFIPFHSLINLFVILNFIPFIDTIVSLRTKSQQASFFLLFLPVVLQFVLLTCVELAILQFIDQQPSNITNWINRFFFPHVWLWLSSLVTVIDFKFVISTCPLHS